MVAREKIALLLLEDGELKAGTAASGNDNTSADPEILVAMGGLSANTWCNPIYCLLTSKPILTLTMVH